MAEEIRKVNDPVKPEVNTITELNEEELKNVSGGYTIQLTNATIMKDV